jgi:hypothetical protein
MTLESLQVTQLLGGDTKFVIGCLNKSDGFRYLTGFELVIIHFSDLLLVRYVENVYKEAFLIHNLHQITPHSTLTSPQSLFGHVCA